MKVEGETEGVQDRRKMSRLRKNPIVLRASLVDGHRGVEQLSWGHPGMPSNLMGRICWNLGSGLVPIIANTSVLLMMCQALFYVLCTY